MFLCVVQPAERKIEESKLVLEGLVQHYLVVNENDKSRHLVDLLDNLDFNQVSSYPFESHHLHNLHRSVRSMMYAVLNHIKRICCVSHAMWMGIERVS